MAFDSLVLVLAGCFATPLLHVLKRDNFGLNLFALAPEDRKFAASVGASVLGIGDYLSRPAAVTDYTVPSLEDACAFNDLLLVVGCAEEFKSATAFCPCEGGFEMNAGGLRRATLSTQNRNVPCFSKIEMSPLLAGVNHLNPAFWFG